MMQASRLIAGISAAAVMIVISGCGSQGHDLSFRKKMVVDYRSKSSPLECIEYVGSHKVTGKDISRDGRKLTVGNLIVRWKGSFTTERTGIYAVTFTSNMSEDTDITKSITVADISAPKIVIPNRKVSVSLDELKALNPQNLFYVKDNSDDDISISADYEKSPSSSGDYPMKITAIDASGNAGKAKMTLHVSVPEQPKPAESQPRQDPQSKEPQTTQGQTGTGGRQTDRKRDEAQSGNDASGSTPQPSVQKKDRKATAQPRTFAFREGSDMNATYQEAMAYARSMLSQGSASGYDIAPVQGSDGVYTGYRVTFS